MLHVYSNYQKNSLYITLAGHFEPGEVRSAAAEAILKEVAKLRPGFDLITDIRQFHPTDQDGVTIMQQVARSLLDLGMGRCVRVTGIPLSALQMERVSEAVGYEPVHAYSLEEAEKLLAVRLTSTPAERILSGEALRQHRRVSVGPEYTVHFQMGDQAFEAVRITNLSAQGCFAVLERQGSTLLYEGAILYDFYLNHDDLPGTRISAKIVRFVKNLTEISEDDVGLGIMFLSPPPSFTQWVDAYVAALFDPES